MDQYKEELSKMEKEVMHLKRDGENKAMHLSQLDMILEQTRTELDKKTNAGKQQVSWALLPAYLYLKKWTKVRIWDGGVWRNNEWSVFCLWSMNKIEYS